MSGLSKESNMKMNDRIETRLAELSLVLPAVPASIGNFKPGHFHGNTLYLSGQGPLLENGQLAVGKVGQNVTVDQAYHHAKRTGLVLIAAMKDLLGSLDRVDGIIKILGFVNAGPDFSDHPRVINGCSDLFLDVFQDRGEHARTSIGVASLPGGISVEIEAIVTVSRSD